MRQTIVMPVFMLFLGTVAGEPPISEASGVEKALGDYTYPSWKITVTHTASHGTKRLNCLEASTSDELAKVVAHYTNKIGERAKEVIRATGLEGPGAGTTGGWADDRVFVIVKSAPSASEPVDTCVVTIQNASSCVSMVLCRPKDAKFTRIMLTQATTVESR